MPVHNRRFCSVKCSSRNATRPPTVCFPYDADGQLKQTKQALAALTSDQRLTPASGSPCFCLFLTSHIRNSVQSPRRKSASSCRSALKIFTYFPGTREAHNVYTPTYRMYERCRARDGLRSAQHVKESRRLKSVAPFDCLCAGVSNHI